MGVKERLLDFEHVDGLLEAQPLLRAFAAHLLQNPDEIGAEQQHLEAAEQEGELLHVVGRGERDVPGHVELHHPAAFADGKIMREEQHFLLS